jgi:hypothetical protein
MNYTEIRRLSLFVFIGFLILTALIAMISVLTGTFGEVQWKILGTTFTISAASICSMACAAFMEKKKQVPIATVGIVLCVTTAVLVIAGMWPEIESEEYWKATATCGVLALAFAHTFLLALPNLDDRQKWIQLVSSISISILALLIIAGIWIQNQKWEDLYFRVLAVVAILVGLQTLVIPILMKLRKSQGSAREILVLEKIEGDFYTDNDGKKYRLMEIDTEIK